MVIGASSIAHARWCNFCQQREATVRLTGYFKGQDEPVTLEACVSCARKALDNEDHD